MKARVDALGRAQGVGLPGSVVIQATGAEFADAVVVHLHRITQPAVDPCAGLRSLVRRLRVELVPALVRPAFSWWPAFGGSADMAIEKPLDLHLPGVAIDHIGILAGKRGQPWLFEKGIEQWPVRCTARHIDRVLLRRRPGAGRGKHL
ncbi:hypothetical protein D3C81_770890 [compost metagenome]